VRILPREVGDLRLTLRTVTKYDVAGQGSEISGQNLAKCDSGAGESLSISFESEPFSALQFVERERPGEPRPVISSLIQGGAPQLKTARLKNYAASSRLTYAPISDSDLIRAPPLSSQSVSTLRFHGRSNRKHLIPAALISSKFSGLSSA
jgi:hypothetical protein